MFWFILPNNYKSHYGPDQEGSAAGRNIEKQSGVPDIHLDEEGLQFHPHQDPASDGSQGGQQTVGSSCFSQTSWFGTGPDRHRELC
jgi:hypothetical protein